MLTLRTKLFYLEKTKRQKDCNDMEKILIVEDDIAFGTMIQTWLRKKGFEVEKNDFGESSYTGLGEVGKWI